MHQHDRNGFDFLLGNAGCDPLHRIDVEGEPHRAMHIDALRHREPQLAWHQRLRPLDEHIVLVEAAFVGDFKAVAKPFSGNQRDLGALALDDRVGRKRGAVHEHADVGEGQTGPLQHRRRTIDDGLLRRSRRGQHL